MKDAVPHFVPIMLERHQITEAEMDDAGIVSYNAEGQLPSEELVIHRRRACVLNGDCIIADNAAHRQQIRDAPVMAAARRAEAQKEAAAKRLRDAQAAVERGLASQARAEA
eukprot:CAMPEP_0185040056 /NCGR_PEP_ID=MMETSP1103-20130426/37673_1 /TAXON_ID=36769 /ORGANISM="Paraphysomonas bandaiensis, Strain Caron Lab Isolate" /LENGTH=110 /DNA_ID=CAMNT_0027579199 /DNA_START=47 /DNA_END=376 /DNA_ORIENTATION=-